MTEAAKEWEPRELIPTAQFAQQELVLPQEVADKHGGFSMYYVPALWGIFAALDDPAVPEVACMKSAQQAWTTGLIAYLANRICNAPGPMIGIFAGGIQAKDFHDEKLVPIIEETPALASRIEVRKTRTSGNRSDFKKFPGGFLKLGGSGSVGKLKSTSAGLLFVEEPDDAKEDVRNQGAAIQLLFERAKRRTGIKRIIGGTPSLKGLSQIEHYTGRGDRRVLPVVCHDCGDSHVLDLEHVRWAQKEDGPPHPVYGMADPDSAVYVCPHCGSPWDDWRRQQNIRATVDDAMSAGDPLCGWTPTRPYHGVASFVELNEAYSCLPGVGMAEYVRDRLEAEHALRQGDQTKMIVLVNSKEGRPYEFKSDQADAEALEAAALDYPEGVVPAGGLRLCIGVDVQGNRLSVLLRAYGREQESWLVLWTEPAAAVSVHNRDDPVWSELDRMCFSPYPTEDGLQLYPAAISIDSGDGNTNDAVYHWVQTRARQHPGVQIMAIKGASVDREIFSLPTPKSVNPLNPKKPSKADRWGLKVYEVGTWRGKDHLSARWKLEASGQGRHHAYKSVRADYWEQVLSEVKAPSKTHRGKMTWQPKIGVAHEALDCEVYVEHAARSLKTHILTPAQWDAIERQLRQRDLLLPAEPVAAASVDDDGEQDAPPAPPEASTPARQPPPKPTPRAAAPPRRPRGNFVSGWRR